MWCILYEINYRVQTGDPGVASSLYVGMVVNLVQVLHTLMAAVCKLDVCGYSHACLFSAFLPHTPAFPCLVLRFLPAGGLVKYTLLSAYNYYYLINKMNALAVKEQSVMAKLTYCNLF